MKESTSLRIFSNIAATLHSPVWQYHLGAIIYPSERVAERDENNKMEAVGITETSGPLASTTCKDTSVAQ